MSRGVGDVEIRDAVLADMAALRDVFRRSSLSNDGDRASLLAHPEVLEYEDGLVRDGHTRVAVRDGRVLGFASAVPTGDALELEDLFVDPDSMRQGIAHALVRDVVARARRAGVRRIDVSANPHALDFYGSIGFIVGDSIEMRFGHAYRMHLDVLEC